MPRKMAIPWRLQASVVMVFLLAASAPRVESCGTMLHTDIGERASQYFNLVSEGVDYSWLLRRHPDALQAGSPYPDAYYSGLCYDGIYHQVSEDTHWTPFLNATVNYIRRVYPKPWDTFTEKLVVFLLGIAQHQVADVSWHSLGVDYGFLDTMGKVNYHGSFSDAHSDGDVGGDILTLFETDTSFIGVVAQWYVPMDDLVAIYEELYGQPGRMTKEVIENCTMLLFLGRLGESLGVLELLYPRLAEDSPFILDRLGDYYIGGVDDMAVWSGNLWTRTVTMLDKGTSACDLPNNPIDIRCNGTDRNLGKYRLQGSKTSSYNGKTRREFDRWMLNQDEIVKRRAGRGLHLSTREPLERLIQKHQNLDEVHPVFCNGTCETPIASYKTEQSYSRFGKHVVSGDLNGDGFIDVVVSAPGYSTPGNYQVGRVYVVYGSADGIPNTDLIIETSADLTLTGQRLNGRFGASVAIVDFNADGLSDLVVGAPSVGSETLDYRGQVYVFLNNQFTGIPDSPSITIDCTERYCNFGWTLESGDLNGDGFSDLIVGSPYAAAGGIQRGLVGIFYSDSGYQSGNTLTQLDFDWTHTGSQDYEWSGFSLSSGTVNSESVILVGAPTYRICARPGCDYVDTDIQSVGRVYVYSSLSLVQIVDGKREFEQFGFSVKVANWNSLDVAVVSSVSGEPTGSDSIQLGVVQVFGLNSGGLEPEPLVTLNGDRQFSRFGATALVYHSPTEAKDFLFISAPYRSEDLRTDRESGRVFMYENFPEPGLEPNRIFGIPEDKARFGNSITIVPSQNKVQLVVGMEHYTYTTRLGGAVAVFDL